MRKRSLRIIVIIAAFCISFTSLPLMSGTLDANAMAKKKKAAKNITLQATASGYYGATLTWNKIKQPCKGYAVFRDGYVVAHLGKKATSFKDSGLSAGSSHTYYIRTYKTKKSRVYYNKHTGQWQKKKPAKKYRGGSKKVTTYIYKKTSSYARVTTPSKPVPVAPTPKQYTVTWKNHDGTVLATEIYKEGAAPSYKGATPTRPDSEYYTFTFSKWDPAVTAVKSNVIYTAKFTAAGKQNSDTTTGGNTSASTPSSGSTANKKM